MSSTYYDIKRPVMDDRNARMGDIVHATDYEGTLGIYARCGVLLHTEHSDWVAAAKNADWTEDPVDCIECLGARQTTEEEEDEACLRSLTKSTSWHTR